MNGSRTSLRPQPPPSPGGHGVRASMYDTEYGDEDHYDYISAYTDDLDGGDDRRASSAGYGQARYATNLDSGR